MDLLLAVDAIRRIVPKTTIDLIIPYFPYGRQDRVCNRGEALSVKVMADLINSLHCNRVTIFDPHSDVTSNLLKNCQVISHAEIVERSGLLELIKSKGLMLLSPDAGAEKRVSLVAQKLARVGRGMNTVKILSAKKQRAPYTGKIAAVSVYDGKATGEDIIILDDICDGGRTFIELAKSLQKMGAKDIYLYVTHGIFSQGLEVLKKYFKHIYCFHTMLSKELQHDKNKNFLTVLGKNKKLEELTNFMR